MTVNCLNKKKSNICIIIIIIISDVVLLSALCVVQMLILTLNSTCIVFLSFEIESLWYHMRHTALVYENKEEEKRPNPLPWLSDLKLDWTCFLSVRSLTDTQRDESKQKQKKKKWKFSKCDDDLMKTDNIISIYRLSRSSVIKLNNDRYRVNNMDAFEDRQRKIKMNT